MLLQAKQNMHLMKEKKQLTYCQEQYFSLSTELVVFTDLPSLLFAPVVKNGKFQ